MKLEASVQREYPKFWSYVRLLLPRLASDDDVVDTMNELVGLDKQRIREALQWKKGPLLLVVDDLVCKGNEGAAGCFRPARPDRIEVDAGRVRGYESGGQAVFKTPNKAVVPRVGVTVLHELVHWADHQVDERATPVDARVYHDVGSKWEWIVFGVALPEMQLD